MTPVEGSLDLGLATGLDQIFGHILSEWSDLAARLAAAYADASLLRDVTLLLILLMTAASAEILFWCYAMPSLRGIEAARPATPGRRVTLAAQRLMLKLFGIAISCGAAFGATRLLSWPEIVEGVTLVAVAGLGVIRVGVALARFALSPRQPLLRLWPASDLEARRLERRIRTLLVLAAGGAMAGAVLDGLLAAPALAGLVEAAAAVAVAGLVVSAIADWARRRRATSVRGRRGLGDLMPFGAVVLVMVMLALVLAEEARLAATLGLVAGLVLADAAVGVMLRTLLGPPEMAERPMMTLATEPVLRRLLRVVLAVLAFVSVLAVWRINLFMEATGEGVLAHAIRQAINVAVVVLLCDLAWVFARTLINRQLMAMPLTEGEAASRLSTLLPMIRTSLMIVLLGLIVLVTLSAMGVNIAPLLAGAGVVGLAIGFGAQSLVRDVITGVFFLIEDAFRVGEYVDVGTRKGTVEAISLRSLRLRHQRGALHTVPFGEIKSLSNESRDWSIVKLEFRIPFDTDLSKVKKIIKAINAAISADPELGPNLIEPLKSQGINRFEEYWMVLRVKYTAKPNSYQFMIRREAYQKIRDAFDAAGIKLGERSVKVEVAGSAAGVAAGAVVEDEEERIGSGIGE